MDESAPWQPVFDQLRELSESWPAPEWSWDTRLSMIASSFERAHEAAATTSAARALPQSWTSKTLDTAPAVLRALAERTGGLRAKQLLLGNDQHAGIVIYGLWWPWGSGDTITLRIGIAHRDRATDPFPRLRELFGVTT